MRRNGVARRVVFLAIMCVSWTASLGASDSPYFPNVTSTKPDPHLGSDFRDPPATAGPWVFWMWFGRDTTRAAITADLQAMHAKGIKGAILYNTHAGEIRNAAFKMVATNCGHRKVRTKDFPGAHTTPIPTKSVPRWSPRAMQLYCFAAGEAQRLGIKLCLTMGLAGTSGPISFKYGNQKLVWSHVQVVGPKPEYDVTLPVASRREFTHDIAVLAVPDKPAFGVKSVIDLSNKVDASGHLHWAVPAGKWKIFRFSYTPTGARTLGEVYTDGMSQEAMDQTWKVTVGRLLKQMTPQQRKGLMGVEDDSWEAGGTTWTAKFPAEFKQLRGYDLIPWLPVLAGEPMGSPAQIKAVKRDYRRTIADLIAKNHYGRLRTLVDRAGMTFFTECAGPNTNQADTLLNCKYADMAMGEFWVPSYHRPSLNSRFLLRNAANGNHLYGKRITACESFTSIGPLWEQSFYSMKTTADRAFADGCNLNVIHNFSQSPSVTAKPGYVYFAGTEYNRNTTWWNQTPAFNHYLARCSFMLQQGLFTADALYYRGDDIGHGEPRKTEPALPAPGYDHDNCDTEALLTRVSVKDGRLVLPDGMSYRILVLPRRLGVTLAALKKIAALAEAGATVVGPAPAGPINLSDAAARQQFQALESDLWGSGDGTKKIGSGQVIANQTPGEVLKSLGVPPDFSYKATSGEGKLDWIHRTAGDTDIYFVANLCQSAEQVDATFRVSGKQPEIWNPVTGHIRDAAAFSQKNGRTTVPLHFNPRGSVFVVFRKPIAKTASGSAGSNAPMFKAVKTIAGPWTVNFDPKWDGPKQVTFNKLVDWTKRPEQGIKYYSGTAVYHNHFTLSKIPGAGRRLMLDLGAVHVVASVKVNGKELGVVWTKPFRVDITSAAHAGINKLAITVVNLWPNRLIGDARLPKDKRLTVTNQHKFSAATPLYPSGLDGPVTLEVATQP